MIIINKREIALSLYDAQALTEESALMQKWEELQLFFDLSQDAFQLSRPSAPRIASRLALLEFYQKTDYRDTKYNPFVLQEFSKFTASDPRLCSFSHTKDMGAVLLASSENYRGIGVDVEWSDRSMKPGAEKYFIQHEDDRKLLEQYSLLEIWAIKEACFKSLTLPMMGTNQLIKSVILKHPNHFICQHQNIFIAGEFEKQHFTFSKRELIVATAWISKHDAH